MKEKIDVLISKEGLRNLEKSWGPEIEEVLFSKGWDERAGEEMEGMMRLQLKPTEYLILGRSFRKDVEQLGGSIS